MKVIIIGNKGQLGQELTAQCKQAGINFSGADLPELDITNSKQINEFLSQKNISVVINAAAYTNVDHAEDDPENAFAVNANGPMNLSEYCQAQRIPIIHISTDYVFDGTAKAPYKPEDTVLPLGVYGQSKEKGERFVRKAQKHIIIRTSWLYSVYGHNFVKTILRLANERETINVVSDQFGCPTCAQDFAADIIRIVNHLEHRSTQIWGTYHYCGSGMTTWYDFANKIIEYAKQFNSYKIKKIYPVSTSEYPVRAKRPLFSVLDCSKIDNLFNISRKNWTDSLYTTIKRLLS